MKSNKLKLRSTLKEKRHYLVIKTIRKLTDKEIKDQIDKAVLNFIGTLGYASSGLQYIKVSGQNVIISITTKYVDYVKTALTLYSNMKCVGVSGTINKAQRFLK